MSNAKIKAVKPAEKGRVVNAMTQAFSADPAARWLLPNMQQYLKCFPSFIEAFAGPAWDRGSACCVDDYSGAALWLPPLIHPDDAALALILQKIVPERDRAEKFALFERLASCHPPEPHWYLPMIGVVPAKQGKGYGSALLRHGLARCDDEEKLAYLESSSAKNIPLYKRHGFELLGTIQVGSSPPFFPMLRKPQVY